MSLVQSVQKLDASTVRSAYGVIAAILVPLIGILDFVLGKDITLSAFFVLPIAVAAWNVGRTFAFVLAVLSVAISVAEQFVFDFGDKSYAVLLWNGTIPLSVYTVVIVLIHRVQFLQQDLERRVAERTVDLTREIAERRDLERGMLESAERELRKIGRDIHDGLCQQLTGTALAGQALAEKLAADGRAEAKESGRIVEHIEDAIATARNLAKGLNPVELQAEGLMQALEELAATTTEMSGVSCRFECDSPVLLRSPAVAVNLFRIAQEAVSNALKHSNASEITVRLDSIDIGVKLSVTDNGRGIQHPRYTGHGLGLRSMTERAQMIAADLSIWRRLNGGTEVSCIAPVRTGDP